MCIPLPAELLVPLLHATSDNVTRSALTIKALSAYLKLSSIREPHTQDTIEIIRLRTTLESKDEIVRRADEARGALRLALERRNIKGEPRDLKDDKQYCEMEKRSLQFIESNNSASDV